MKKLRLVEGSSLVLCEVFLWLKRLPLIIAALSLDRVAYSEIVFTNETPVVSTALQSRHRVGKQIIDSCI